MVKKSKLIASIAVLLVFKLTSKTIPIKHDKIDKGRGSRDSFPCESKIISGLLKIAGPLN
jgi:hypothetical protein